jgi:hypothetical protein
MPSNGLLPFLRGYICEINDTCYDYPVNNNYDEKFFTNISELAFKVSDSLSSIVNNAETVADLSSLFQVGSLIMNQRLEASNYTRKYVTWDGKTVKIIYFFVLKKRKFNASGHGLLPEKLFKHN